MTGVQPKTGPDRGDAASWALSVPWRVFMALMRAIGRLLERDISLIAAGLSFFALISIFPGIIVAVSLFGALVSPGEILQQVEMVAEFLPPEAARLLTQQLSDLAERSISSLSIQGLVALTLAVWGAIRGLRALVAGLHLLHDEPDPRGFLSFNLLVLMFALGAFGLGIFSAFLATFVPPILNAITLPFVEDIRVPRLSYGLSGGAVLLGLVMLYRFGMSRRRTPWMPCFAGASLAAALWLGGSYAFSAYVRFVADYNETYGSIGAVVVFLMWLYVSAHAVLLGGAFAAQLQHAFDTPSPDGAQPPASAD
jgi:membrane protein